MSESELLARENQRILYEINDARNYAPKIARTPKIETMHGRVVVRMVIKTDLVGLWRRTNFS